MDTGTYKSLVLSIAHIKNLYRNYIFKEKPIIPGVLYDCIANSGIDDQEICSRLKKCPCCNSFFIVKEKKKPKKYCDDKCKAFFKPRSRQKDRGVKKKARKDKKDKLKELDLSVIMEKYRVRMKGKYRKVLDKNEAEMIYNKLPKKEKKELKSLETIGIFILG